MRRTATTLGALLLLAVAQLAITAPGSRAEELPAVTTTRLRIVLDTTSDWARIRIRGVTFPVRRTLEEAAGDPVTWSGDAWTIVNRDGGSARSVVDVIATEQAGTQQFEVSVEQGRVGTTTAQVHDDRRGAGPVLSLTAGGSAAITSARTVTRAELLGPAELELPHGDPRRLVLAAYYPWFKRDANPTAVMAEQPLQPRSAWDLADVRSHVGQARAAGLDGFAVSWAGQTSNGTQLDLVLQAMDEQGGVAVPYLETTEAAGGLGGVDQTVVARWLDEALSRAAHPSFLRTAAGTPVVFVYAMEKLDGATWAAIVADSARRGRPVQLVGDADPSTHAAVLAGWHRYGATGTTARAATLWRTMAQRLRGPHLLDPTAPLPITVATVSPGYDDTRLRGSRNEVIQRGANGERYDGTWTAALAADPDWILVTSWNEWFEGTEIEPGTRWGDRALAQTQAHAAAWKAGAPPSPGTTAPPPPTTTTTVPAAEPPPTGLLPWLLRPLCGSCT
jgi:hypothetical protein